VGSRRVWAAGATLAVGLASSGGCGGRSSSDAQDCPAGTLNCACGPNESCLEGLACEADRCVELGQSNGPELSGGAGGAASGAAPEAGHPCEELAGLADCDLVSREVHRIDTNILLVLDRSRSMAEPAEGHSASKWEVVTSALASVLPNIGDGVYGPRYNFGLELFPTSATASPIESDCGGRCCEMPDHAEMNVPVTPMPEGASAILEALQQTGPAGEAPIARALERARDYFTVGSGATLGGERYVLLISSGKANCNPTLSCEASECTLNLDQVEGCSSQSEDSCCDGHPSGCLDARDATAHIQQLRQLGIRTIVVGLPDTGLYSTTLEEFARAGGAENDSGELAYYGADPDGGVQGTIASLFAPITRAGPHSCEFIIPRDRVSDDLGNIRVWFDCELILQSGSAGGSGWEYIYDDQGSVASGSAGGSGWEYIYDQDNRVVSLRLIGPVCERMQTEWIQRIDVLLGCPESEE